MKVLNWAKEKIINSWNSFPKVWALIFLVVILIGLIAGIDKAGICLFILGGAWIGFINIRALILWIKSKRK